MDGHSTWTLARSYFVNNSFNFIFNFHHSLDISFAYTKTITTKQYQTKPTTVYCLLNNFFIINAREPGSLASSLFRGKISSYTVIPICISSNSEFFPCFVKITYAIIFFDSHEALEDFHHSGIHPVIHSLSLPRQPLHILSLLGLKQLQQHLIILRLPIGNHPKITGDIRTVFPVFCQLFL